MLDRRTEIHYETMEKIEAIKGTIEVLKAAYAAELMTKEKYNEQLLYALNELRKFM